MKQFGYDKFRHGQEKAVKRILSGTINDLRLWYKKKYTILLSLANRYCKTIFKFKRQTFIPEVDSVDNTDFPSSDSGAVNCVLKLFLSN